MSRLSDNIGTLIAAFIVLALVGFALFTVIKDRKKGKSACGCGCEHCAMSGCCHKTK